MSQLTLQIPDALIDALKRVAAKESLTVEDFVARMLVERLRVDEMWERRVAAGRGVTRERFLEILAKAGDAPPEATDRVE